MHSSDNLFAQALAAADVVSISEEKLTRSGNHLRGRCPLCKASAKRQEGGAFSYDRTRKTWKCWSCTPRRHDLIDLEHKLRGKPEETLRDAALRILGRTAEPVDVEKDRAQRRALAEEAAAADERTRRWKQAMALSLWRDALPAAGSIVETYLRSRGISGLVLEEALKQVRFHPGAYHHGPTANPVTAPAMVGLRMTRLGPTGGVHVTYLQDDGSGKTTMDPQRRVWGPPSREDADGIMHPGGVWLTSPRAEGPLIVAEGIETALAAAMELGIPCRVVATLSLHNLQGGYEPDSRGRYDLKNLRPNPLLPAFTWPEPADAPWGAPIICVDRDMTPVPIMTVGDDDETVEETLSGDDRALLSALLASAAWIESGAAWVSPVAPCTAGWDFGDQRQARLAGILNRPAMMEIGLIPGDLVGSSISEFESHR